MEAQNEENDKKVYPFNIDYLPDEFIRKAELELHETPGKSQLLIKELKSLAKKDKALEDIDFHEDFLRLILRHSKYNLQKAFKRLQSHIKFRKNHGVIFESVDPEKIRTVEDYQYCTVLPWRCYDGCTITHFDMSKWDPDTIPVEDLMRLGLSLYHQGLRNPVMQINGAKCICDWKGAHIRQAKIFTPMTLYRSFQAFLNLIPARIKELHMVNETLTMKIFWTLFKPFLTAKLKRRYIFHSKPEDLLNYFPKKSLPVQYGGDLENYFDEEWMIHANEQQMLATLAGQKNIF